MIVDGRRRKLLRLAQMQLLIVLAVSKIEEGTTMKKILIWAFGALLLSTRA